MITVFLLITLLKKAGVYVDWNVVIKTAKERDTSLNNSWSNVLDNASENSIFVCTKKSFFILLTFALFKSAK